MWKLLVVEDESIVRMGLKYMLDWEKQGIAWQAEAASGDQALDIIKQERIDIVLTDIQMPGMNGLELAKQINKLNQNIKIIFLSSYDSFAYAKEALRLGCIDYLHKPTMDEQELKQAFSKVVTMLEESYDNQQPIAAPRDNSSLLRLLDSYTFPQDLSCLGPHMQELQNGFWLVNFRRRDDAVKEKASNSELRFISLKHLIEEYVMKTWGGLVFHREQREIIWLAPAKPRLEETSLDRAKYLEGIKQKMLELLNMIIMYSESRLFYDVNELPDAYMETLMKLPVNEQSDNFVARRAKEFIDAHLLEELNLSLVASRIHVSPSYLSRIFMREIGENFSDYMIRNKIEYAQRLLRESSMKVYEIAAAVGYMNPHYFSKLFKERVGMTPLDYRNR